MADKQTALAIVLRTVDKASAGFGVVDKGLKKIKESAKEAGPPLDQLKEKLNQIGKATGITAALEIWRAAAGTIMGVFSAVSATMQHVVSGVLALIAHFDDMGDKAEKLNVTVDFLTAMRYAAERSGSSAETLDQGLTALAENMGQLRAGGGRMLKFLTSVSPALVEQLKHTKGNEAAFRLLADAMSAITDPQKRLALAMKTVGNSDLAPMLARGSSGLLELQGAFIGLAGSQEDAAEEGGKVDDLLRDLKASSEGFKAALMRGLAPALQHLIPMMTEWLSGHREQIAQWMLDFGAKLPGAVDAVVEAIKGAIAWVEEVVQSMGGWDALGRTLKDLLQGGLVGAMLTVKVAAGQLGTAVKIMMLAWEVSPMKAIIDWCEKLGKFLDDIGVNLEHVLSLFMKLAGLPGMDHLLDTPQLDAIDKTTTASGAQEQPVFGDRAFRGPYPLEARPASYGPPLPPSQPAKLTVEFKNAPRGTRATADPRNAVDVDMTMGYQMGIGL